MAAHVNILNLHPKDHEDGGWDCWSESRSNHTGLLSGRRIGSASPPPTTAPSPKAQGKNNVISTHHGQSRVDVENKKSKSSSSSLCSSAANDKDGQQKKKEKNSTSTGTSQSNSENNKNKLSGKLNKDHSCSNPTRGGDEVSIEVSVFSGCSDGSGSGSGKLPSPKTPRLRQTSIKTTTPPTSPTTTSTRTIRRTKMIPKQQAPSPLGDTTATAAAGEERRAMKEERDMMEQQDGGGVDGDGAASVKDASVVSTVTSKDLAGFQVTVASGNISLWEMRQRFKRDFPTEPIPSDTVIRQLYRSDQIAVYDLRERFRADNKTANMPADEELRRIYLKPLNTTSTTAVKINHSRRGTSSSTSDQEFITNLDKRSWETSDVFDQVGHENRVYDSLGDFGTMGSVHVSSADDRLHRSRSTGLIGHVESRRGRRKNDDDLGWRSVHSGSSPRGKSSDRSRRGRHTSKVHSAFQDKEPSPSRTTNDQSRRERRKVDADLTDEDGLENSNHGGSTLKCRRGVDADIFDDSLEGFGTTRSVHGSSADDRLHRSTGHTGRDESRRGRRKNDDDLGCRSDHSGSSPRGKSSDRSRIGRHTSEVHLEFQDKEASPSRTTNDQSRMGRRKVDANLTDEDGLENSNHGRPTLKCQRGVDADMSDEKNPCKLSSNDRSLKAQRKVDADLSEDDVGRGIARSGSQGGLSPRSRSKDRLRRRRKVDDGSGSPEAPSQGMARTRSPISTHQRSNSRDRLARERCRMAASTHCSTPSKEDKKEHQIPYSHSSLVDALAFAALMHGRGSHHLPHSRSDGDESDDEAVVPLTPMITLSMTDEAISLGLSGKARSPATGIPALGDFVVDEAATPNPFAALAPTIAPSRRDEIKKIRMVSSAKGREKETAVQRQEELVMTSGHKSRRIKYVPKPKEKNSDGSKVAPVSTVTEGDEPGDGFLTSLAALNHAADPKPSREVWPKEEKALSVAGTSGWALEGVPGATRNMGSAQVELDVGVSEPVSALTVGSKKPVRQMMSRRQLVPF